MARVILSMRAYKHHSLIQLSFALTAASGRLHTVSWDRYGFSWAAGARLWDDV